MKALGVKKQQGFVVNFNFHGPIYFQQGGPRLHHEEGVRYNENYRLTVPASEPLRASNHFGLKS